MMLAISLSVMSACGASAEVQDVLRPGVNSLTEKAADGTIIKASVTVGLLPAGLRRFSGYWGVDDGSPAIAVTALAISVGRDKVNIPFTAWADLGYPTSLRLAVSERGATLVLDGGDTSTHYTASWFIQKGELRKRRVELGEFASEVWQETTYSSLPLEDDGL
jgi:hypothetical protein